MGGLGRVLKNTNEKGGHVMFKLNINTEEKTLKAEKHKKFTFTFEKKSSNLLNQLLKLIKFWSKK